MAWNLEAGKPRLLGQQSAIWERERNYQDPPHHDSRLSSVYSIGVDTMLSGPPLAAVALMAFLGLALFRRKKKDDDAKAEVEGAEAEEAEAEASEPAGRPAPKPLVLKAFVLNRKAELVGELAAEGEAMGVGYDGVLELLEGKGLTRVKRIDSPPYTVHILQREEYFMVAFTRSRDDRAVLDEAGALFADTLRDLA